jgi:L-2-hydroxyglutarate oxidase LhgO
MIEQYEVETLVVGAGVVGLAVARQLALSGQEVWLVEQEPLIGSHTSSRNSEVIHAGIYYPAGSLKAQLCVRGKALLYGYCAQNGISHQRLGKLIVATRPDQIDYLHQLKAKGNANGVHDLVLLDQQTVHEMEPEIDALTALWSPSTGIVDSHALMQQLQRDFERAGGQLVLHTRVRASCLAAGDLRFELVGQNALVRARRCVNAAGLSAISLLRDCADFPAERLPSAQFAKGSYFSYAGRPSFKHLIYPVPEVGGLGVHLTLDLSGGARFGPDVEWLEGPGEDFDYRVVASKRECFAGEIRKYWPTLDEDQLLPAYSGIRPKISGPTEPAADFMIQTERDHGVSGLVNLFGIESPGLTASLALAERVAASF